MSEQNVITLQNDYTTMDNIKAAPSVYSPNNGNFNSEENLKWLANKLATKPFVIGKTTEEMRDNMKPILDGNIIKISDGLFSIQGYTFKMAEQGHLSFDAELNNDSQNVELDITPANNFIRDITVFNDPGATTTPKYNGCTIDANLDTMCFNEYQPKRFADTSEHWETLQSNWEKAIKKHTSIGYVRLIYNQDIRDLITVTNNAVIFGKNKILRITSGSMINIFENNKVVIPDNIRMFINNEYPGTPNVYGLTTNDAICLGAHDTDTDRRQLNIYYPVFVKWHREINNDKKYPVIYFKDIFGTTFYHSESFVANYEYIKDVSTDVIKEQTTNYYPYTNSNFINMYENIPESSILSNDYELFSKPTGIYYYQNLYSDNGHGDRNAVIQNYIQGPDKNIESVKTSSDPISSTVFSKITLSELIQYIPEDDDKYTKIENTLYYYSLNDIPDAYKLTVTVNGQTKNVPVIFMASNGRLCPDGIFVDASDTTVTNIYPAEGYVHFIKRMYLINTGESNPTEEMINSVTPEMIMENWAPNSNFSNFYRDYISKAVSVYLSWCYSALMSHSIFEKISDTDSYKIKAIGCGNALLSTSPSTITDEGSYVSQQYSYTGYERTTNGLVTKRMVATLPYYKNTKSDFLLVKNGVVIDNDDYNNICGDGSLRYLSNKIPSNINPVDASTLVDAAFMFDDPINLIQKCSLKSSTNPILNVSTFRLWFVFIPSGQSYYCVHTSNIREFSNVVLDDNFMPVTPEIEVTEENAAESEYKTPFAYPDKLAGRFITYNDSMINSMRFTIRTLSWYASIWETVNLKKDALNYLCGRYIPQTPDPEEPQDEYDGIHFNPKVRADFDKDDLGIYQILISSNNTNTNTGFQDLDKYISYSEESDVVRGSYIHIDKVYGDDDKSLDEIIRELVNAIEVASEPVDLTEIWDYIHNIVEPDIDRVESQSKERDQEIYARVSACENKLDPYIVKKYNMGYTSQGTPTDSIIAEVYNNGMCIIRGSGEMYDFINFSSGVTEEEQINTFIKYYRPDNPEYIRPPQGQYNPEGIANPPIQQITDVIIMPGITTIGAGVFDRPSKLPGTDTDIDPFDFNSVTIPDTVEFIGSRALLKTNTKGIELNRNGLSGITCEHFSLGNTGIKSLYIQNNDNFAQDSLGGARNFDLKNVVFDCDTIDKLGLGTNLASYNNITLTKNVKKLTGRSFYGYRLVDSSVVDVDHWNDYEDKDRFGLFKIKYLSSVNNFLSIDVESSKDSGDGGSSDFWYFTWTGFVYWTSGAAKPTYLEEVICDDCTIRYDVNTSNANQKPIINGLKFSDTSIPDNWLFGVRQSNFHRPDPDTVGWIMYIDNNVKYIGNNAFAGQSELYILRYNGSKEDFGYYTRITENDTTTITPSQSGLIFSSGEDWMSKKHTNSNLNSNISYIVCNKYTSDDPLTYPDPIGYDWLYVERDNDEYYIFPYTGTIPQDLDPDNWDMYWKIEQS